MDELEREEYRRMVKELFEYCQTLHIGLLGQRHSTNLIHDHKRQAEEIKKYKWLEEHYVAVGQRNSEFIELNKKCCQLEEEIQQLRAENERLRDKASNLAVAAGAGRDLEDALEEMFSALSQFSKPAKEDKTNGGWRSIDSVPKDGTDVLLLDINYDPKVTSDWWHSYSNGDGHWENAVVMSDFEPTHWKLIDEPQPPINNKQ